MCITREPCVTIMSALLYGRGTGAKMWIGIPSKAPKEWRVRDEGGGGIYIYDGTRSNDKLDQREIDRQSDR